MTVSTRTGTRWCSRCATHRDDSEFSALGRWCRACHSAYNRARYRANRAAKVALRQKWTQANRAKRSAQWMARWHAMRTGDYRDVTDAEWRRMCARYQGRCAYCGAPGLLTKDHVVPVGRGGRHSIGNVLPACVPCNSSKGNRFLVEWRAGKPAGQSHV